MTVRRENVFEQLRNALGIGLAAVLVAAFAGCSKKQSAPGDAKGVIQSGSAAQKIYKIAVVPKGASHPFWKAVHSGVKRASEEFGCKAKWTPPVDEANFTEQVNIVNNFATESVDGMILAPLNADSLLTPVQAFGKSGKPVVIFDSGLNGVQGEDFVSFVGTDNKAAGAAGGEALAKAIGNNSKVVLLRYMENSASTEGREAGFLEAAASAGLEVISSDQYAGSTVAAAKERATNMLDTIIRAGGIFASNQSASLGVYETLMDAMKAGKIKKGQIKFVAFDAHPTLVEALLAGDVSAIVLQSPENMGYKAVLTMLQQLKGETVPAMVDTGAFVATADNLAEPALREALLAYDDKIGVILKAAGK
jgi:ribose transport system substrate-binding protein